MPDYRENFKRKEVKYRLTREQRISIEAQVAKHLTPGIYGRTQINSLYFDTPERSIIARSLEKPLYKEKLRLRWYGNSPAWETDSLFLELKKKFKGIVYKRRTQITHRSAARLVEGNTCDPHAIETCPTTVDKKVTQLQITREIRAFIERHEGMASSALIKCTRMAYEQGNTSGLRITFDSDLRADDIAAHTSNIDLLCEGESIMEIKCNGPYPDWLVEVLSKTKTYPTSFSKYGELYKLSGRVRGRSLLTHFGQGMPEFDLENANKMCQK